MPTLDSLAAARGAAVRSVEPALSRGPLARVVDWLRPVWMGPGAPPAPTAPVEERPRVFDYPPGINIFKLPETLKRNESGGFTFAQLRSLSAQTVVNGAIYHAIDKIKKVEFTFVLKPKQGETAEQAKARSDVDPRITELQTFFESPDRERDWPEWIADAWLQILVCDNLSIYRWPLDDFGSGRARAGAYALDILDGDHIQPVIDDTGRVPRAADAVAYVQWTKGSPRKDFTRAELMYPTCWPSAQRVMGCSPVERLWFYLNVALRRDLTKLNWYSDGNIPAGLIPYDPGKMSPDQAKQTQVFLDLIASGDPAARSKMLMIPVGDAKPIFPTEKALLDPFDDYLARLACFFVGVPVTALIKEHNRSTSESSRDSADEEGELPRIDFTRRLINRIVRNWWGYDDVVVRPRQDVEVDALKQAEIDDLGVRNGTRQIDEVRLRNGDVPLGLPHGVMTSSGFVPLDWVEPADETLEMEKSQKKKSGCAYRPSSRSASVY